MLVLAVDSSTPAVTAALARVGDRVDLLAERVTVDGRAHGELLAPAIAEVLAEAGARPDELAAVVAGVGPGPFTGLRVGLVTAVAFGQALDRPTYGVCSLDAIAFGQPGRVLAATDARRKEIYFAAYDGGVRTDGPSVARPETVDPAGFDRAIGDGAHRYEATLGLSVIDEPRYPSALALVELAADRIRAKAPSEPLNPLYLRRPDAEPNLRARPPQNPLRPSPAVLPGERKPTLR